VKQDKIFVDTDIALDLLASRLPHHNFAAKLFTLADQSMVQLFVSSLSFSNLHYLLSRQFSRSESLKILRDFKVPGT
jgi:predicted nucleic acid-binding protein